MSLWVGTVDLELAGGGLPKRFRSGRWVLEGGQLLVSPGKGNPLLTKPLSDAEYTLEPMPNSAVKLVVKFTNGDRSSICHALPRSPSVVTEVCAIIDAAQRQKQHQQMEVDEDNNDDVKPKKMNVWPANKQRMMKYFEGKTDNCHIVSGMDVESEMPPLISASEVVLTVASRELAAQFEQKKSTDSVTIEIPAFDHLTVYSAIRFCHTLSLADDDDADSLLAFADRYEMDSLRAACSDRLQLLISTHGLPITISQQPANKQRMKKHFEENGGGRCQIVSRMQVENEWQEMIIRALEVVLTVASPVLAAEFEQETSTDSASIVIRNFDHRTVYSAVCFCHTLSLADDDDADSLLEFADRYEMAELRSAAANRLLNVAAAQWPTTSAADLPVAANDDRVEEIEEEGRLKDAEEAAETLDDEAQRRFVAMLQGYGSRREVLFYKGRSPISASALSVTILLLLLNAPEIDEEAEAIDDGKPHKIWLRAGNNSVTSVTAYPHVFAEIAKYRDSQKNE